MHGNYFPAPNGISKHSLPRTIVNGGQVNFKKDLTHSYGDYVQANTTHLVKNNNLPRTLDFIYIQVLSKAGIRLWVWPLGALYCDNQSSLA